MVDGGAPGSGLARSAVFITAFNRVERALRGLAGDAQPFRQLISMLRRSNALVRRYHDELVEMSELRNAIVHDSVDPVAIIAEPSEAATALISRIADLFEAPPRLLDLFGGKVITVRETDTLRHALELMVNNDYSQLPVYNRYGRLSDLLTERRIAQWYGRRVVAGENCDPNLAVEAVLRSAAGPAHRNYALLHAGATIFDAEELFAGNHNLEAIVITAGGKVHERPLGIVTAGDLARQAMDVTNSARN